MQNHTTSIALTLLDGEPRVDSRVIADQLGVNHQNARELLQDYQADFEQLGVFRFETGKPSPGSVGGRPEKFALLNEDQSYLLLAYAKNTPQARALKIQLVLAFGAYRRGAAQPAFARPLSAAIHSSINRQAWRMAQAAYSQYRAAMLEAAQLDPAFSAELWTPDGGPARRH